MSLSNNSDYESRSLLSESRSLLSESSSSPSKDAHAVAHLSTSRTAVSLVGIIMGGGLLSLPYAVSLAGWLTLPLMALVCIVSNSTTEAIAALLLKHNLSTYADIGEKAYGKYGRIAVLCVHKTALYAVATLFLVLSGVNLHAIASSAASSSQTMPSTAVWIMISGAVVLPTVWIRQVHDSPWLTALGAFASLFASIAVVIDASSVISRDDAHSGQEVFKFRGVPMAMASVSLAYGVQAVAPSVVASMKNPYSFGWSMRSASAFIMAVYALVAAIGYGAYGSKTTSPIVLNMEKGAPLTIIAIAAVTAHVMSICPVVLNPVLLTIEGKRPWANRFLWRTAFRSAVFATCVVLAVVVPFFGDLLALIGALFNSFLTFVFPALFFVKIEFATLGFLKRFYYIAVTVIGVVLAILGTIAAISTLADDIKSNPPSF
eukprot:ANDGO_05664.mRNA.1 Amino acid transporter ANTL1